VFTRRIPVLLLAISVLVPLPAFAQAGDTATALTNTPVYLNPGGSDTPLRVAARGTTFEVLGQSGEWTQVRFQDPQWGPRAGYVATKDLRVHHPELEPMDLSIGATRQQQSTAVGAAPAGQAATVAVRSSRGDRWPRGYLVGRGGLTFGTRTAPLVGVEVGGRITSMLQGYGSFDWHRDISPSYVQDILDVANAIYGVDVNVRFPTYTVMGGVKVIAPRGSFRPYGLGGFGYGRVNGTIEVEGKDVTDLLDSLGYIDRTDITFNKVLFEVGGGVAASNGRVYVDISYRFRKFLQTGEPINVSGLYAGAGVGF
jgi:opacity protein-like surface antigen